MTLCRSSWSHRSQFTISTQFTRVGGYGSSIDIDGSYDSYYARLLTKDYYENGEYRLEFCTTCCNPLETSSRLRNSFVALRLFAENQKLRKQTKNETNQIIFSYILGISTNNNYFKLKVNSTHLKTNILIMKTLLLSFWLSMVPLAYSGICSTLVRPLITCLFNQH